MKKWLCVLLVAAGCNLASDTGDDRPATLEFVTEAILKPSCGTAECHSAMKAQSGYVFDSVAAMRQTMAAHTDLVHTCGTLETPQPFPCGDAAVNASDLYRVIDFQDSRGNRMPLDQALSNKDIVLIRTWLRDDAPGIE